MDSVAEIYEARVESGSIAGDPAQRDVLTQFDRILAALGEVSPKRRAGLFGNLLKRETPQPVRGLYLWGGVGRGKSFLMDLFFEAVPIEAKRRVHFHAFMQEIHEGLHAARQRGVDDAIRPVAEGVARDVRLLCFDEMQITDITDAMIVGRLFQALFDAGVVVVATSNRPPDDLYKDGLNRQLFLPFIQLIKERMVIWHLESPTDYRQNRLAGAQVYFTPANAEAREAIDAIWENLSGGQSEPLTLAVKGREVVLNRYANGVARVEFFDLCGKPLGPGDYLAVANAVRVLILENIPRLSRQNFNEARRFVTLIDALYEARVRLIASAAAVPERLYVEGEGAFEFERTASRLREMQAEGWGDEDAG